jgi:transcriptional regulator with XRE-family HTH domain
MFTEKLEVVRKDRNMKQAAFAEEIGVSDRAYRDYVNGDARMPFDKKQYAKEQLGDPRLDAALLAEQDNLFAPADLEVDTHPCSEYVHCVNESSEVLDAVRRVDPTHPDIKLIEHAMDQMFDMLHLIPKVIESWSQAYKIDPYRVRQRNIAKLRARGYLKEEDE